MDAQQFLAEFGHIVNAPAGIARLRELVLQLAITGRLTERQEGDTRADDLIALNVKAKSALWMARKIKRQPDPSQISGNDAPWRLPEGWEWTRLGAVTNYGDAPKVEFNEVSPDTWVLELEDIEKNTSKLLNRVLAKGRRFKSTKNGFPAGAVLYGKLRPYLDKVLIAETAGVCTTEIAPISFFDQIEQGYLRWYLKSPYFINYASGSTYGMNLPRMGTGSAREAPFPFPPKEEQSVIVAKINALMKICDTLEEQKEQQRNLQHSLRQSTLQAVATAISPHELQSSWARLVDNFRHLFQAAEDVDQFIAELKNMAVRGLLSLPSQDSPDLDEIVAACSQLRAQYVESGLMRRQKIIATVETDVTYPGHWALAPFDEVAIVIGGVTKGRNLRGREVVTCPYLAVANVQRGFFNLNEMKEIQIAREELEKYLVKDGDLLITEGGDWDKVGRTAIWRGGVENCLHQNHIFKARIPAQSLLNEWVELVLNSGVGRDYFAGASKQTTNLASINMTQLRSFPLPIPPLDEQQAIMKKLEFLSKRCDVWREQLGKKQTLASLLATTYVAAFTGMPPEG
ncbi:restriction endonuclease subunit S [uncultured Thiodictyon sp.]|uniref:restriction endonuclease subunit S n=1 Tax=uncultured Thiodictyon sp. TaxID=1846217 RepID=UPI0025E100F9|nr:restriction endonuclease subunit S [uncultured Thiodictyon sp.]